MTVKDETERCLAIAASERAEAEATPLNQVRDLKLRSAMRWEELAKRGSVRR